MNIKLHSWYNHFPNHSPVDGEPYIDCYNDCVILDEKDNIQPNSIALLIEPRPIIPDVYEWIEKNDTKFKYIFTHDSKLLSIYSHTLPIIWGGGGGGIDEYPHIEKTKNVSLVSSYKEATYLHKQRIELARELKNNPDVTVMGTFDGGDHVPQREIYQDYRFCIAYENHIDKFWFTEKICNCFVNKVIPIYIGTPYIGNWFNTDGIIECRDNYAVKQVLENLKTIGFEKVYELKKDVIEDNYKRVQQFDRFENWFFRTYSAELEGMKNG